MKSIKKYSSIHKLYLVLTGISFFSFSPGMRKDCDLAIFIDVPKALSGKINLFYMMYLIQRVVCMCFCVLACADGIQFFWSENGVLLTAGDTEGKLAPKYFSRALRLRPTSKKK